MRSLLLSRRLEPAAAYLRRLPLCHRTAPAPHLPTRRVPTSRATRGRGRGEAAPPNSHLEAYRGGAPSSRCVHLASQHLLPSGNPGPLAILCAITARGSDDLSAIYNIDGGGAPPLPKADPACAAHTPRATAGGSAGHGSPRARAWLAMRRLPLRPEGGHTKNLAGGRGWDGSNVLRRRPRLHEPNEQKQASMEGSSMHHPMLPPSSLTSLAMLEEGLEPRALPPSLSGSPADLRYPVPLSDPRQALFPSSVLYKKNDTTAGVVDFFSERIVDLIIDSAVGS